MTAASRKAPQIAIVFFIGLLRASVPANKRELPSSYSREAISGIARNATCCKYFQVNSGRKTDSIRGDENTPTSCRSLRHSFFDCFTFLRAHPRAEARRRRSARAQQCDGR